MADGINIRILPRTEVLDPQDLFILDNKFLGTQTLAFSSVVLSGSQVSFYSDFLKLSSYTTSTLLSGGISPSGNIIPSKEGIIYYSSNTKDLFVSVGRYSEKDWKRILTVNY